MAVTAGTGDRRARQRAALRVALRQGDPLTAARAWERLRADPDALGREEFTAGRAARAAVGRALRNARRRSAVTVAGSAAPALPLRPSFIRRRRVLAAVAASAAALVLLLTLAPRPPAGFAPAAAAPEEVVRSDPSATIPPVSARGRTSATLAPVAVAPTPVAVEPTPSALPTPASAPSAAPGPATLPASSGAPGGQAGGVPGGVPSGTPGGTVGGVPGGTGTATLPPQPSASPTPRLLPLNPPPLAAGQDRLLFRVIDASTGAPLRGICVVLGTLDCGANDYYTNDNGYYWLDLSPGMASAWVFKFQSPAYFTQTLTRQYTPGMGTVNLVVSLRHR